jgi:hypothetical protein
MKACKYKIFAIFSHGKKYKKTFLKNSCIEYGTLDLKFYFAMNCTRWQSNWMGKPIETKIELRWKRSDNIYLSEKEVEKLCEIINLLETLYLPFKM